MKTWEDVSDQVKFPAGIRHGTAFRVSADILNKLSRTSNSGHEGLESFFCTGFPYVLLYVIYGEVAGRYFSR
jgi:hypothetical protein